MDVGMLCQHGPTDVWSVVQQQLDRLPPGSEVYWLTYNLGAPRLALDYLMRRRHRVKIVCCHPRSALPDCPRLQRSTFRLWTEHWSPSALRPELRGMRSKDFDDGEPTPRFHAKLVVGKSPDGIRCHGVIGSFNLSESGLFDNFETAVRVNDASAFTAFQEAHRAFLHPSAIDLVEADCVIDDDNEEGVETTASSAERRPTIQYDPIPTNWRMRGRAIPNVPQDPDLLAPAEEVRLRGPELRLIRQALDELLEDWPPHSTSRGWQSRMFRHVVDDFQRDGRMRSVLYLPVGVGKTFIALRWLLWAATRQPERGARGPTLFLVPNEWIQISVRNAIELLISKALHRAEMLAHAPSVEGLRTQAWNFFHVRRASEFVGGVPDAYSAAVVDECHNWDARYEGGKGSYTHVIDRLFERPKTYVLGLSATPCRFEEGRFGRQAFVDLFCGIKQATITTRFTLQGAIQSGLLAPYEIIPLLRKEARQHQDDMMGRGEREAAFGDYDKIVLRQIWEHTIVPYEKEVREKILQHCLRSTKGIIYLPPLGDLIDAFALKMERSLKKCGVDVIDFRSRTQSGEEAKRAFERFGAPTSSGASHASQPMVMLAIDRVSQGVSVDDIDLLVMLRPTLSPRVLIQALGRGLRLAPHKPHKKCVVLDAINLQQWLDRWEEQEDQNA
jgi:superfamily II DNA or RNA helicase